MSPGSRRRATPGDTLQTRPASGPGSGRHVARLAISAFVVLAAEPLFLLVDTAVVGRLGAAQLAGLGAGGTIMSVLAIIGTSLEYGTTARAARFFGAGHRAAAVGEGVQASWLALVIGVATAAAGEVLADPAARLIGGRPDIAAAAASWLRIALCGLPGLLMVQAGNGWSRGVQETRAPVAIVVLSNALSAIASPLLVYAAGLGLRGSAVANVVAQTVGGTLFLRTLRREQQREQVKLLPRWTVIKAQLAACRDLVLRSAAFQSAFLVATSAAGRMGVAQLAAHQIGMQLWSLCALLLDSFAIAAQSLVGAALGASEPTAARRVAWQVARYGLVAGTALAGLALLGSRAIPKAFNTNPAVLHQTSVLWPWLVGMMPVGGLLFALDGVLSGAGDFRFMRTVTLVAALAGFIPVSLAALHFGWGLAGIWSGLATFIAIRCLAMSLRTSHAHWATPGPST